MKGPAMSTNSTSKLTPLQSPTIKILSFKPMLLLSHFRKRDLVANVEGFTATVTALHTDRLATAVGGRTTGHSSVGPEGALHMAAHPPHTSNRTKKAIRQQAAETQTGRRRRKWQVWEEALQQERHSQEGQRKPQQQAFLSQFTPGSCGRERSKYNRS